MYATHTLMYASSGMCKLGPSGAGLLHSGMMLVLQVHQDGYASERLEVMLCQYHAVTHGYAEYIPSTDADMDMQSTEVCCCMGVGCLKHPKPKTSRPEQRATPPAQQGMHMKCRKHKRMIYKCAMRNWLKDTKGSISTSRVRSTSAGGHHSKHECCKHTHQPFAQGRGQARMMCHA